MKKKKEKDQYWICSLFFSFWEASTLWKHVLMFIFDYTYIHVRKKKTNQHSLITIKILNFDPSIHFFKLKRIVFNHSVLSRAGNLRATHDAMQSRYGKYCIDWYITLVMHHYFVNKYILQFSPKTHFCHAHEKRPWWTSVFFF